MREDEIDWLDVQNAPNGTLELSPRRRIER